MRRREWKWSQCVHGSGLSCWLAEKFWKGRRLLVCSTLLHYISFEIWVVKYIWSIQIPKGHYRDHLVGQLTTTYHDAPHLFIIIWGQKPVWILTDNNMHPSSLYYLGSACLNTLWAQSGWMGANNRTPIKGKWHLNWSLLTDRRQMIGFLLYGNVIFYWSLLWTIGVMIVLDSGIWIREITSSTGPCCDRWKTNDSGIWKGNFNTAHFILKF